MTHDAHYLLPYMLHLHLFNHNRMVVTVHCHTLGFCVATPMWMMLWLTLLLVASLVHCLVKYALHSCLYQV
jgi:hypothetical protein